MTEFVGMTAADIAATEYYDGHGDHDDQPFEGNIVLVDARALSDTDRTVVESMREEFDAEVVVLPHPSVTKKKMRRSRATISDVGMDEIGDYIEPESKIAVIPGPGLPDASRDSVLAPIPDDCTSEIISASSLQDAMDGLGKFFGVRHSQESTEKSETTVDDVMEELGIDDKSVGNESGYGIDFENGCMGVMTHKGLELPLAVYKIRDVDYGASFNALGQFALRITRQTPVVTEQGDLIDTEVDLEFTREADARASPQGLHGHGRLDRRSVGCQESPKGTRNHARPVLDDDRGRPCDRADGAGYVEREHHLYEASSTRVG